MEIFPWIKILKTDKTSKVEIDEIWNEIRTQSMFSVALNETKLDQTNILLL